MSVFIGSITCFVEDNLEWHSLDSPVTILELTGYVAILLLCSSSGRTDFASSNRGGKWKGNRRKNFSAFMSVEEGSE